MPPLLIKEGKKIIPLYFLAVVFFGLRRGPKVTYTGKFKPDSKRRFYEPDQKKETETQVALQEGLP
jgi:hypothetical protein